MARKLTHEKVKKFIEDNGCNLISREYISSRKPLLIECKCGNRFQRSWCNFKNLNNRTCGCDKNRVQWNLYNVGRLCKSNDIEFLSDKYTKNSEEYTFKCKCGNTFNRTWSSMLQNSYDCGCESGRITWDIHRVADNCRAVGVEFLSNSYKSSGDTYRFKCKCGNIFERRWDVFYNCKFYYCSCTSGRVDWDIEKVRERCKKIGVRFLSENYRRGSDVYLFGCECGNEFSTTWAPIASGHTSPKCEMCRGRIDWDIVKVKEFIESNSDCKLLSHNYIDSDTNLKIMCACGEVFFTSISKFRDRDKKQCNICSDRVKWTEDAIREKVDSEGLSMYVKLLDEYPHAGAKIQLLCNCGNKFTTDIRHFIHDDKKECYQCKVQEGYHSKTLAERNKQQWIKKPAKIYFIRCFNEDESFVKIGITTRKTKTRALSIPYDYDVLSEINTNLYDAIYLESELHDLHKQYSYTPNKKFGGWTECFTQVLPGVIKMWYEQKQNGLDTDLQKSRNGLELTF